MRKTFVLIISFLVVSMIAVLSSAQDEENVEVRYTCNTNLGAIEIHLTDYDKILEGNRTTWHGEPVPWEQAQTIKTIKGAGSEEHYLRKAGKPVKYECVLKSGRYVISFGAHWLNDNVEGTDGMDIWPTVKITRGKETILPSTIIGSCDTGRSVLGSCGTKWAVRAFLFHSGDKPCLTVDRFTKDWVR